MGRVGTASRHSCILGRYASDTLKGRPETGKFASGIFFQVTGAGHRGIGPSGVSRSAFGSRLRVPAAAMGRVGTASRHSCIFSGPLELSLCLPCHLVNLSTGQLVYFSS